MNPLTLFEKQIWPLNEKVPNLECLTLYDINSDELNLFLSNIMSFKKLTELNITSSTRFCNNTVWESFHSLTKNIHSLRKIKLENIILSFESTYDWNNDTITHMTIQIKTTDDLIILLHNFSNLHFLDVCIDKFEAPHAKQ
ncbi:unnamed protein product [Rotaria sp. Silwood1]|nr:unnamed protein product [Rotaria sp. Silwood1]CAF3671174.1 unnamed protein product [Rotaria sp. Silwood1]CAF4801493.1 unnamed protein product [Rotaria sp. Silwood1]